MKVKHVYQLKLGVRERDPAGSGGGAGGSLSTNSGGQRRGSGREGGKQHEAKPFLSKN